MHHQRENTNNINTYVYYPFPIQKMSDAEGVEDKPEELTTALAIDTPVESIDELEV